MLCDCQACGFRFTQDFPSEQEIGRYYETNDYVSHSDTSTGIVNKLYHIVRKYMLHKKARIVEKHASLLDNQSKRRLLDIGTGTGYFAETMSKRGWEVTATEKSMHAREYAKTHLHLDILPESALFTLPSTTTFDVITLWHVMEHLEQLNQTWERLRELLSPNGVLIIAVPNSQSYDAQHYQETWAAYDVPRHLWHFTFETMRESGKKHGFALTAYYTMPFDAFYVSMLSEKNRARHLSFLRGFIQGLLGLVSTWTNKNHSSSLIYIFHKQGIG